MLGGSSSLGRLFFLLFVFGCSVHPEDCYGMAQTQDHFKPISIDDAPPEVAQELKRQAGNGIEYHLKIGGIKDDAVGFDLVVVRIEGQDCDGKFCPTYIKYTFKGGLPASRALILNCEEWLVVGDQFRPIRSGTEVVGVAAWIVLKTDVGEARVTFTKLGPEVSFKK
jgi:hypothetical protein